VPTTAQFTANPRGIAATYGVLVVEPPGLLGALAIGQNHNINPAMQMNFDFSSAGGIMAGTAVCTILANPTGTSTPCYFLPYLPDGATTMTIGGPPDYFFTSMLTGCTVRVSGPRNGPTITHSNAGNVFKTTAGGIAVATAAAQNAINNMMPAPAGGICTAVTRMTMEAAYTPGNLAAARAAYQVQGGYRVKEFAADQVTSHGIQRPELGMFVFGVRDHLGWQFYSSTSTTVHGRQKTGQTYFGLINVGVQNAFINDSVNLGGAPRFWP
jgi:hypothetical protein